MRWVGGEMKSLKGHLLSLLTSACSCMDHLHQLHALLLTSGHLRDDPFLLSELLRFCSLHPCGNLLHARALLLLSPNASAAAAPWNHLIRGCASRGHPTLALHAFADMRRRSLAPSELTFPFLLKACASLRDARTGTQLHSDALKRGNASSVHVANSLLSFYASCGELRRARQVFDGMPVRTLVSWNALLTACLRNGLPEDSVALFRKMLASSGFDPDATTAVVVLSACAELGNLGLARWAHSRVVAGGAWDDGNVRLGTTVVDMYAKCGAPRVAREVFDGMPQRSVWTWSAMILGLAQHGLAAEALELFARMESSSVKPNAVTFLGVLSACSHAGLVEEGLRLFAEMQEVHGVEPGMAHYSAIVDVLGRSGRLEEACRLVEGIPSEPEAVVLRTLLHACSLHGDGGVVGERVRSRLMAAEAGRCGNYVLWANMLAGRGRWDEAATVRRRMRKEGLRKAAGESCVEVGGTVHRFFSGTDRHLFGQGIVRKKGDEGKVGKGMPTEGVVN